MIKVAVYGTLKRGYGNHSVLGKQAKFLGEGITEGKYIMKNAGFPAILRDDKGSRILVEVYEVPEEQMGPLDRLEGVPYMYTRETENIGMLVEETDKVESPVFIYVGTKESFGRNQEYPADTKMGALVWDGYKERSRPVAGSFHD